jgi:hypothetical protein
LPGEAGKDYEATVVIIVVPENKGTSSVIYSVKG